MLAALPVLHFIPQQSAEHAETQQYQCPLYQTSARSGALGCCNTGQSNSFVLHLSLPIPGNTKVAD